MTAGSHLSRLIEQAGVNTTPSALLLASLVCAAVAALAAYVFLRFPSPSSYVCRSAPHFQCCGCCSDDPAGSRHSRSSFDALDLISRLLRAGHAFQAAIGMAADELTSLRRLSSRRSSINRISGSLEGCPNALTERVPLLDVKFFVTAVAIQRDTEATWRKFSTTLPTSFASVSRFSGR